MNNTNKKEVKQLIINILMAVMLVSLIASAEVTFPSQKVEVLAKEETEALESTTEAQNTIIKSVVVTSVESTPKPKVYTCKTAVEEVFKGNEIQANKVAFCESSHNHLAKSNKSTAKGCFQIINGTWKQFKCSGDPLNALDNVKCAKKIYDYYGGWGTSGGWQASKHCHKLK